MLHIRALKQWFSSGRKKATYKRPGFHISQHAFVYFELHARAFRACVRVQFFVWRGSIIPPTEEGLSPKRLDYQQIFDNLKTLLSLISNSLSSASLVGGRKTLDVADHVTACDTNFSTGVESTDTFLSILT